MSLTQLSSPEEVPFELLHLELVSSALNTSSTSSSKELPSLSASDLELLGFNAGFRLIERLTRESNRFKDELDLMKFICKDFWGAVFRKQVSLCFILFIYNGYPPKKFTTSKSRLPLIFRQESYFNRLVNGVKN